MSSPESVIRGLIVVSEHDRAQGRAPAGRGPPSLDPWPRDRGSEGLVSPVSDAYGNPGMMPVFGLIFSVEAVSNSRIGE